MHFQILNLATNRFYSNSDGSGPCMYPDGNDAAYWARILTDQTGQKHQPRRIVDDSNWRRRETDRMCDGTYMPVPWAYQRWFRDHHNPEHFLHVSLDKPGFVAFTPDAEAGAADRQTRMRAGAYLTKFFESVLTHDEITRYATELAAAQEENEVLFATDADKIEWVYRNGPSSCMSHSVDDYESDIHPVRVYAHGDLAIAYLVREDGNRVSARTVVWPEKKIFTRIYGDDTRIKPLLKALGYQSGSLNGAKMARIECRGGYVCPYLDEGDGVKVKKDHLLITSDYDDSAESTSGLIMVDEAYATCSHCDDTIHDEDDAYTVYIRRGHSETWCCSCYENCSVYCEDEGITVHKDSVVKMADDTYWSDWKFEREGGTCERTDECYSLDELQTVYQANDSVESWGPSACDDYAVKCDVTGHLYADDAVVELPDGRTVGYDTEEAKAAESTDEADEATAINTADYVSTTAVDYAIQIDQTVTLQVAYAPVAADLTIKVDDWVICHALCYGQFTPGRTYRVSRLYPDDISGEPRISVYADDAGDRNGWCAKHFTPVINTTTPVTTVDEIAF